MIIRFDSTRPRSLGSVSSFFRLIMLLCCLTLLSACERGLEEQVVLTGETMGTTYSVKLVDWRGNPLSLQTEIDVRLEAVNDLFSTYRPDSELSRLNAMRGGGPVAASDELLAVLRLSREVHRMTAGAFDVTVGPLVNLWGFGPNGPRNGVPTDDEIRAALNQTGFDRVRFGDGEVSRPDDLYIDLSAIAKGYAVDEIAELVEAAGALRYMVEIGGEVLVRGDNQRGEPWVIGLEAPDRDRRSLQRALPLKDTGLATSGDYRNYFQHAGKVYSHTIDPKTGWPVTHGQASVTVLHPSTALADGLATAFSVMGPEQTQRLAEEMNLPVLAIIRGADGYREVMSPAMQRYLEAEK